MSRVRRQVASSVWRVEEPRGSAEQLVYRQYNDYVDDLITNLAANPSERTGLWADTAIHCLVQEVTGSELTELDACITAAQALSPPMPIFPAMRVFATSNPTFDKWVDRDYWVARASELRTLAAHRVAGDPRIGIDAENYGSTGPGAHEEPTQTTLALYGYTEAQFNWATLPFIEACADLGVYVCGVYPIVNGEREHQHLLATRLVEMLGADRVELWWERSFGTTLTILRTSATDARETLVGLAQTEALFERELGISGLRHRHVVDADVFCNWGQPTRDLLDAFGPRRPWVYDNWRVVNSVDQRTKYGLPTFKKGTTSYTVNDWDYWWECTPTINTPNPTSVGTATALEMPTHRSASQSTTAAGPCTTKDMNGWKLDPGSEATLPSDIYGVFRVSALPLNTSSTKNNWTVYAEMTLPTGLASNKPVLGQTMTNFGSWQVYYDSAAGQLKWQPSSGSTQTLGSVTLGTSFKLLIARNGNTGWKFCLDGGTVTSYTHGVTLGNTEVLIIGGGEEVAAMHSANKIESVDGIVVRRVGVSSRTLSDTEISNVMSLGYPAGI